MLNGSGGDLMQIELSVSVCVDVVEDSLEHLPLLWSWLRESVLVEECSEGTVSLMLGDGSS